MHIYLYLYTYTIFDNGDKTYHTNLLKRYYNLIKLKIGIYDFDDPHVIPTPNITILLCSVFLYYY